MIDRAVCQRSFYFVSASVWHFLIVETQMNLKTPLVAAFALVCLVGFSFAQEAEKCQDGSCPTGTCPVTKAMKDLPVMTYKVGDKSACCSKSAAELAEKASLPIHFVVAKKTYDQQGKAFTALVEQTESFVKEYTTPCKCDVSGATKIAGKSCNCPVEAGKTAELVKAAVSKVKMSYAVGEKSCNCPVEAATLAKSTGAKKEFVVAGEKTCCEMTARLNLARAQYKAAVEAVVATKKEKTETKPGV